MESEWDKNVATQSRPRTVEIVLSSIEIIVNVSKICFTKFQILYLFLSHILVFLNYTLFKRFAKEREGKIC
jgi:uncharacterized membrane protein YsdA (DUF1294 family)